MCNWQQTLRRNYIKECLFQLQVINILIAIKESGPSFLAPTLEKAIDILKNSEIFLPQLQSFKPDDQLTSELVSSLISVSVCNYFDLNFKLR